jgi:nitroreductase
MNPKLNFIFARRSIRKFAARDVSREVLNDLLAAAMAAPSAVAKDPWHFLVLTERATLERLADVLPNAPMLRHAPAAVIACGDIDLAHDREISFLLQDLSAAVQNLLLAAAVLGLGTCWLGVHPRTERMEGIRKLFTLPVNVIPVAGIALGWPNEQKAPRTRFSAERVHFEQW